MLAPDPISISPLSRMLRRYAAGLVLLMLTLCGTGACAGTLEDVRRAGTLKVCIWPNYFAISYRNPRTGLLQGIDIELSKAFAQDLGVAVELVDTDFARLLSDLEARKCHIAMMGVGVTPQRAERVAFSRPYLSSDVYAVTTRANQSIRAWDDLDKPGRIVVVQRGTFMEPLMRRTLVHAKLSTVQKPNEREREVQSGRADAFITDYAYSQRVLINTDWARVVAPARPVQLTDYAYAVPKDEPEWLARVDRFVREIKQDGRLAAAAGRNNLLPIVVKD
jgi:ABC-type amino acid transport substrate-binding protein